MKSLLPALINSLLVVVRRRRCVVIVIDANNL